MKIVVTGGRKFGLAPEEYAMIRTTLDGYWTNDLRLAHGAAEGVDLVAKKWYIDRVKRANIMRTEPKAYPADWNRFRNGAGHKRNEAMLKGFKPDILVSFPGGAGTHDCEVQAHGLRILIHRYDATGLCEVIEPEQDLLALIGADLTEPLFAEYPPGDKGGDVVGSVISNNHDGTVNVIMHTGNPHLNSGIEISGGSYTRHPLTTGSTITPGVMVAIDSAGRARPYRQN